MANFTALAEEALAALKNLIEHNFGEVEGH
jgi:hypothetical protein